MTRAQVVLKDVGILLPAYALMKAGIAHFLPSYMLILGSLTFVRQLV